MQTRFLLGPAGSGKTFRCLAEIRAELLRAPEGPPLILLAPKQATFQLERQLLAGGVVPGYTRLQILSFERLARFVLEQLRVVPPELLSEEGRVMVLRALLLQRGGELKRFGPSARRPGFAQQISALLSELQDHGVSAAKLTALSERTGLPPALQGKLHDLSLLAQAYADWLTEHQLQDANRLLDSATEALRAEVRSQKPEVRPPPSGLRPLAAALWLDGFAEMTPQELDLLAVVLPWCERATLAFCLDPSDAAPDSWLSIWSLVGKSYAQCRERVAALKTGEVEIEVLHRDPARSRFAHNPALAHLESRWSNPASFTQHATRNTPLRLVACANPDAEATLAAREVLRFVRAGGRFREAAVLVRNLDGYHKPLARTFRRYGIPFFLDRREGVAHHPLAELTRSALRTVTFDWQHEDWFAALKAGFSAVEESDLDRLENEALARGWRGAKWRQPLPLASEDPQARSLERLRQKVLPPFEQLAQRLESVARRPTGPQLADAVREFWARSDVETTLDRWTAGPIANDHTTGEQSAIRNPQSAIHSTVWDQMNAWLDSLALAFPREALSLRDWLPVLEAGLANLTVGVIPPALDQVLIGAIDRARNPELRLALVLGLNEGVFPAAPSAPLILSDADRDELSGRGVALGPDLRERLARERYFGYIACTRASEQLILTCAQQDADGRTLNASSLLSHVRRLFPDLKTEEFHGETEVKEAEHVCELVVPLMALERGAPVPPGWPALLELPKLAALREALGQLQNPNPAERLPPALVEKLYGPELKTSVSRLENFAACPFRFLVHSGLRAEERKLFELDVREQGSFQHEVLKAFHEELRAEGRHWRDLTPTDARKRIGRVAGGLMSAYRDGLLHDSAQTEFTARALTRALQDFIEVIVGWMRSRYQFDPAAVELLFDEKGEVPAWKLSLGGGRQLQLRGRIDRVDLFKPPDADAALCVVVDYKSSGKKLDPVLLEHGVQLQLLSYLNVLRQWPDPRSLGVSRLVPAGVFYVNLHGGPATGDSRATLATASEARKKAHRHSGRFDVGVLQILDASGDSRGEQFNFRLTKDGTPYANSAEVLSSAEFTELLARVEAQLRKMGERIYAGDAQVDPYRKGTETPCRFCDYAHVCRIDPWTHEYRVLRKADKSDGSEKGTHNES